MIIADSLNSIIYSVEHDLDEDNVEILLKRSDNVNYPQALCIGNEGHLIVVECSVLTQHALKNLSTSFLYMSFTFNHIKC